MITPSNQVGLVGVGLIGVGLLGLAIAERLAKQNASILGFDTDGQRLELLREYGKPSSSAQEVIDNCDFVLISLPTSEICSAVLQSVHLRPEQTIIDTTTGDPDQMIAIGERLSAQQVHYVEATIAGSSQQMRHGEAVIFLGCHEATRSRTTELISLLSTKVFHLGEVGAASRFKLVHNLILGLHRAVLAEGLSFAEALGFDPTSTLETLKETPAASGVMSTKGPKMVESNFATQARLSQHLKDVRLILAEANRHGTSTPLSELHRTLLEKCEELGFGDEDNSAIIEAYRSHRSH